MLDVHPPTHAANTWRDFFIHIATIVVGLLIAIGLEQSVEYLHNRHLLHHTEANLRAEMQDNRSVLARDETHLDEQEARIESNLLILAAVQAHKPVSADFNEYWTWNAPRSVAWDVARSNTAVTLMPYETSEAWSDVYGQQTIVAEQTALYIRDIYRVYGPLSKGRQPGDLRPEELATMVADSHQLLADLGLLRDLTRGLDHVYAHAGPIVE